MRAVLAGLVISMAALIGASSASAQSRGGLSAQASSGGGEEEGGDDNCGTLYWDGCSGEGAHWVGSQYQGTKGVQIGCLVCMSGGQAVSPNNCHGHCGVAMLSPAEAAAYLEARKAAFSGRVTDLLRVASRTGGFVLYNTKRNAVQLLDCTARQVIASFRVTGSERLAVAIRLPDIAEAQPRLIATIARSLMASSAGPSTASDRTHNP